MTKAVIARPPPAGLWRRFSAMVYDGFLLTALVFVGSWLFLKLFGDATQGPLRHVYQLFLLGLCACYLVYCWYRLCGISPLKMTMGSFAAGAAYAAFTGIIAAPFLLASTHVGLEMLIKGFIALAIGGLGSHWGTLLGGILIACIESFGSGYLSPGIRQLLLLTVFLSILFVRPYGFFGQAVGREV